MKYNNNILTRNTIEEIVDNKLLKSEHFMLEQIEAQLDILDNIKKDIWSLLIGFIVVAVLMVIGIAKLGGVYRNINEAWSMIDYHTDKILDIEYDIRDIQY